MSYCYMQGNEKEYGKEYVKNINEWFPFTPGS